MSRPRASPAGPFPSHSPQRSAPPQGVCCVVIPILTARLPAASGSILVHSFVSDLNVSQISLTAPPSRPPTAPPSRPPLPRGPSLRAPLCHMVHSRWTLLSSLKMAIPRPWALLQVAPAFCPEAPPSRPPVAPPSRHPSIPRPLPHGPLCHVVHSRWTLLSSLQMAIPRLWALLQVAPAF